MFDYLAGPPDITEAECGIITDWVKSRRLNDRAICKAVLPNTAADSEAVANFATEGSERRRGHSRRYSTAPASRD